jgi:O-antigen/teichoic acid export membrane protein
VVSPESVPPARGRIRQHLSDPLYATGYYLILGAGLTSVLGVAFWALAAHSYSARVVGLNAAAISAMNLVAEACTLGLASVLVRYLPIAGGATRRLIARSYAITSSLALGVAVVVALTSGVWSPKLSFLAGGAWMVAFVLAAVSTTVFILQDSVLTGMRAARWVPVENSLFALAKLLLLVGVATTLSGSGPFVAWITPLPIAILLVNWLIFRRLVPAVSSESLLDRRSMRSMATGNYAGKLFALATIFYLPILVANRVGAADAAYFFVPWMVALAIELVALNVMASLTVEAAGDTALLRGLARRSLAHAMRLVIPIAVATAIFAPWALLVFGGDYSDEGALLLRLLAVGMVPNAVVTLGISVARIQHRGRIVVAVQGTHSVVVLGLSALLVPSVGIDAVGFVWTASNTLLAAILLGTLLRPLLFPLRSVPVAARGSSP